MKWLVLGREGQLARSLAEVTGTDAAFDISFAGRPDIDFERPGDLEALIGDMSPDVVINAAAYTAVDDAEDHRDLAFRINAVAVGEAAAAAARCGAVFILPSTDYVFPGASDRPWVEDDVVAPLNAYGESKLAGESAALAANASSLVVRTSWLVSPFGKNFAATMLRLASDRERISVVDDQVGSPTSAIWLATTLIGLAKRATDARPLGQNILHAAGTGSCSWAELAGYIMEVSRDVGGPFADIDPIPSSQFPVRARRPAYSVLDTSRLANVLGTDIPTWQEQVRPVVERLVSTAR